MIVVVMAGGKGSRFGHVEKPMINLAGIPLIDHVMRPLLAYGLKTVIAVSSNTQDTARHCKSSNYEVVMTDGNDYHEDLCYLTDLFGVILTVVSDIPFLTQAHIKAILDSDRGGDSVVACTMDRDELMPFGLNIVDGPRDRYLLFDNDFVEINVNTQDDLDFAEQIYLNVDCNRKVKSRLLLSPSQKLD